MPIGPGADGHAHGRLHRRAGGWPRARRIRRVEPHRAALLGWRTAVRGGGRRGRGAIIEEAQPQRTALDDVVVAQHVPLDACAVDQGAVGAAEVLDDEPALLEHELRVLARHHRVVGADGAVEAAADEHRLGLRQLDGAVAPLAVSEHHAACHAQRNATALCPTWTTQAARKTASLLPMRTTSPGARRCLGTRWPLT